MHRTSSSASLALSTEVGSPSRSMPSMVIRRGSRSSRCRGAGRQVLRQEHHDVAPHAGPCSAAVRRRSCVSYQSSRSSETTRRCSRTRSSAIAPPAAIASSPGSSTSRSSRCALARARTVVGCSATGSNTPGSAASTRRQAAATTGSVAGRRPLPTRAGAAIRSARRSTVSTSRPAMPPKPRARARRTRTPTRLVGTMTVTGASGSASLAVGHGGAQLPVGGPPVPGPDRGHRGRTPVSLLLGHASS